MNENITEKTINGIKYVKTNDINSKNEHFIERELESFLNSDASTIEIDSEINGIPVEEVQINLDNIKGKIMRIPHFDDFFFEKDYTNIKEKKIKLPETIKKIKIQTSDELSIIKNDFSKMFAMPNSKKNKKIIIENNQEESVYNVTDSGELEQIATLTDESYTLTNIKNINNEQNSFFNRVIQMLYPTTEEFMKCDLKRLEENFISFTENNFDMKYIEKYPQLINYSYDEILENIKLNYQYLKEQTSNIIPENNLKDLLFNFEFADNNIKEKISDNINGEFGAKIPLILKLYQYPNERKKQELRDEIIYLSNVVNLNVPNMDASLKRSARKCFGRSIFENIVLQDAKVYENKYRDAPDRIQSGNENDYLAGIHTLLKKEIKRINPALLEYCEDMADDEKKELLTSSLTTIKNWELLSGDKKARATRLKNEILGKLLYSIYTAELKRKGKKFNEANIKRIDLEKIAIDDEFINSVKDIFKSNNEFTHTLSPLTTRNAAIDTAIKNIDSNYQILENGKDQLDEQQIEIVREKQSKLSEKKAKLIEEKKSNGIIIREISPNYVVITKIIEINPYFYEMVLNTPCETDDNLKDQARLGGYDFNDNYKDQKYLTAITQKVLNDIEYRLYDDRGKYLECVRKEVDKYFSSTNESENDLFNIFRSMSTLLRKDYTVDRTAKEFNIDENKIAKFDNELFDLKQKKYNNYDRMCYLLREINLLAHDIEEFHMAKIDLDINRFKNNKIIEPTALQKILKSYSELYNYGLTPEKINDILNTNAYNILEINNSDKTQSNQLKMEILRSRIDLNGNFKEITLQDVGTILEKIENISTVSDEIKKEISEEVQAQRLFFDTKRIIAEHLLKKFKETTATFKETTASIVGDIKEDKVEFFRKNGFIIEYQQDSESGRGNDTVAIYNTKLNEAYSVHMKDVDPSIQIIFQGLNKNGNKTIAHVQTSLLLNKEPLQTKNIHEISAGFHNKKEEKISKEDLSFHNFIEYDLAALKKEYNEIDKNNEDEIKHFCKKLKDALEREVEKPENVTFETNNNQIYSLFEFVCNKIDSNNKKLEVYLLSDDVKNQTTTQNTHQEPEMSNESKNVLENSTIENTSGGKEIANNRIPLPRGPIYTPETKRIIGLKRGVITQNVTKFKKIKSENGKFVLREKINDTEKTNNSSDINNMINEYNNQESNNLAPNQNTPNLAN